MMPHQVGVTVEGDAEAAVRAARAFTGVDGPMRALVELDFRKMFNAIRRNVEKMREKVPLFPSTSVAELQESHKVSVRLGDRLTGYSKLIRRAQPYLA